MPDLTQYVVLHRFRRPAANDPGSASPLAAALHSLPSELWTPIGGEEATRRETAVQQFLDSDAAKDLAEGDHEFRAVPRSSWPDETIPATVETKRVTTVGTTRKESSVQVA